MSYCRMGYDDSDLYVIKTVYGDLQCISCPFLGKEEIYSTRDTRKMIIHMERHLVAEHKVPDEALDRLRKEHKYEQELGEAGQYPQLRHWRNVLRSADGGSHRDQELRKRSQNVIDAITEYLRVEIGDY